MVRRLRVGELQLDFCAVYPYMLYVHVPMFTVYYLVSLINSSSKFQTSLFTCTVGEFYSFFFIRANCPYFAED